MRILVKVLFSFLIFNHSYSALAQQNPATEIKANTQQNEKDHEQLRSLLKKGTEALNQEDFAALKSVFADKFVFTTVDQNVFHDFKSMKSYFESLTKKQGAPVKKIVFKPTATGLTEIMGDFGISYGTSDDEYQFSDGDTRTMRSNWTALLKKQAGEWKVSSIHMGVNPMDNPIIDAAKGAIQKAAIGAGLIALLCGLAIGYFFARRKK